jgi:hypothetical protein
MEVFSLNYAALKSLIIAKALLWQYTETASKYDLFASDNDVAYQTTIAKNSGADQIDFETNYKSNANQRIVTAISATALPLPTGAATESTSATRLANATFTSYIGEVQSSPTSNTVLGRLKDIVSQLTTQVRGLFDSVGNAITSTLVGSKQAMDVNVVSSQSSTATAVDLGQSFGLAFDFSLPSAGTFNPVLLLKNPVESGKRIRVTRINVGLTVANVSGIWRVFVNPTTTANGTAITPANLNVGNVSNPATIAQTFTTPTVTANGTSLFRYESGQNMNSTEIIGDALFVLNPGNTMLLTGDPLSNNRNTVITIYWTEIP